MKLKTQQQGMVLFFTLVFMHVIIVISLSILINSFLSLKAMNHLWQREKDLQVTEEILAKIEFTLLSFRPLCVIPVTSSHYLEKLPAYDWKQFSCSGNLNKIMYYYAVEFLGTDPCALENNFKKTNVDYYRVSLLVIFKKMGDKIIMQGTVAVPSVNPLQVCPSQRHMVSIGSKMHRELVRILQ